MRLPTTSDTAFAADVLAHPRPVLVHATSPECISCVQAEPIVAKVADVLDGVLDVVQLDVDANPITADLFEVAATPTELLFIGGVVRERVIGVKPVTVVLDRLRPHLVSRG